MNRRSQHGMTLIELMVALAIGTFLMLGAVTVFMQSRTAFRVTESMARLQENARFALDTIEPEIRMAHFWGLTPRTYLIQGRTATGAAVDCGDNWKFNLNETVEASTTYANVIGCAINTPPAGSAQVANSDVLVVRRAGEDAVAPADLTAGTPYIQSTRSQLGQIFVGTPIPAGFNTTTSETHRLLASGYFVSTQSAITGVPSLRRKFIQADGTTGGEEIMIGVEDMQIQFGIDTDVPGTPVAPNPNRGSIDRYVNPDDPIIDPTNGAFNPNAEILAVRVWLLLRAESPENGLVDNTIYQYADRNFGVAFTDRFRRLLVSKTIYIRNARPAL